MRHVPLTTPSPLAAARLDTRDRSLNCVIFAVLPRHCLTIVWYLQYCQLPALTMKLPSPNMLVCSRQSATSISQQAIERSRLVFQNLLPYLSTLGTWTRAIDPPACGNDIENSICQDRVRLHLQYLLDGVQPCAVPARPRRRVSGIAELPPRLRCRVTLTRQPPVVRSAADVVYDCDIACTQHRTAYVLCLDAATIEGLTNILTSAYTQRLTIAGRDLGAQHTSSSVCAYKATYMC
jgi:hypothetical protein